MQHSEIASVVTRAGELVATHYVFADVGSRLQALLGEQLNAGRYAAAAGPEALGALVTEDLQSVNGDRHLRLKHHVEPVPDGPDEAAQWEMMRREAARTMGGVGRIERLPGPVAHLELGPILLPAAMAADALIGAMNVVAGAEALLLDLRNSVGGDPSTVALLCTYLFDEQVHLVTMHDRDGAGAVQSWTLPFVPGPRFGGSKPVYVLTSSVTFSGGEELAYDLQQRGRAVVVGERTGGGAHPRTGFRLHPHLEATIPVGRPVSPISGANWEGTGVIPDVDVPAAEAVAVAYARALVDIGAQPLAG